ncbi:DUF3224 domain-containing protein [Rubrivirga sp. IMCC45206]|uniref:DUF3224 domain-containing protein n=1 Tax=Rubrivirga sp. IMCC45206 TaxID=3391614 RepID=UPI0039901E6E
MTATATFDVTAWEPAGADTPEAGPALSRVRIEKAFRSGDVTGTSTGEGLFCGMGDPAAGAGYVVSERITGAIGNRKGSFVIQHGGLMGPGLAPRTFGHVVPGSGTGDLVGLAGTVEIGQTVDGTHTLTLTLDDA